MMRFRVRLAEGFVPSHGDRVTIDALGVAHPPVAAAVEGHALIEAVVSRHAVITFGGSAWSRPKSKR